MGLQNYDGDVMSDMVSTAFGSLAMMTSVLVSPDGIYEYEAAHGTVTQHYYLFLRGEENFYQIQWQHFFCMDRSIKKREEKLDNLPDLYKFAEILETTAIATIEKGIMTGDLISMWESNTPTTKFLR